MASSNFRLFQNLPCELRLQIWEFAIRLDHRTGGLHHFSITTTNQNANEGGLESAVVLENFDSIMDYLFYLAFVPKIGGLGRDPSILSNNQSAYFWDAGLWTACKESRNVMEKHFSKKHEVETIRNYFNLHESVNRHLVASVSVPQLAEAWCLMVQPYKDLFCFTPRDWSLEIDWSKLWFHLPFTTYLRDFGPVQHLAIEFDPSWDLDWPEDFYQLHREKSARGFVSRLLEAALLENMNCFIWLIDQNASSSWASSQQKPRRVFYDLEREYFETELAHGECESSTAFIKKLARAGHDEYPYLGMPNWVNPVLRSGCFTSMITSAFLLVKNYKSSPPEVTGRAFIFTNQADKYHHVAKRIEAHPVTPIKVCFHQRVTRNAQLEKTRTRALLGDSQGN